MSRLFTIFLGGTFLIFGNSLIAEDASDDEDAQKIIKVCTLNSVEANQEFQNNVQLLRLQRQQLVDLKTRLDTVDKAEEKEEIQKKIDELIKKLSENNEIMFKTYGFSLNRNYTMVIEKSHIYMMVTDAEAKQFEEEQAKRNLADEDKNE